MNFYRNPSTQVELSSNMIRLYALLIAMVTFITALLYLTSFPYLFSISVVGLSVLSFYTFIASENYIHRLILLIAVLNTSLIYTAKLLFTDVTGILPVVIFYELTTNLILILIFGWKRVWWVITLSILFNFLKYYLFTNQLFDHWIHLESEHLATFFVVNACVGMTYFLLLYLSQHIKRIGEWANDSFLEQHFAIQEQKERTSILSKLQEKHKETSTKNSHQLRAPLARMQGLIKMVESEVDDANAEMIDLDDQELLHDTFKMSIAELEERLQEMEEDHNEFMAKKLLK